MLKKILPWFIIVAVALFVATASTALAQDPGDGADTKGEVLTESGDNSVEPAPPFLESLPTKAKPSEVVAGNLPAVDLNNLPTHNGQTLPNLAAFKAQALAFVNSLSGDQRAQIKAVLDANPPVYMESLKATLGSPGPMGAPPSPDTAVKLTPEQFKAMDQAGRAWVDQVNASIKAVLAPEQVAGFESTLLPHPQNWAAQLGIQPGNITPQTYTDCANSEYYNYYSSIFAYYYYYYSYYYYTTSAGDPLAYSNYSVSIDTYLTSYYGWYYAYYAYVGWYSYNDALFAWYFSDHAEYAALAGYYLSYEIYWWTGNLDAYWANYWAYYAYLYADPYDAYYCWAT